MNTEKLLILMEKKRRALVFFKDAFKENMDLIDDIDRDDIDFIYKLEKAELDDGIKKFPKYTMGFNYMMLNQSYDYMKNAIHNKKDFKPNNKEIANLLNEYNELTTSISNYSFITLDYITGKKKTNDNKEVVLIISMLKPVLIDILKETDNKITTLRETKEPTNQIESIIGSETEMLNTFKNDLNKANYEYQHTAEKNSRHKKRDKKELVAKKKAWRTARNNACQVILSMYVTLIKLIELISNEEGYDSKLYHCVIGQIVGGEYYQYFLSDEAKEFYTEPNMTKKLKKN